MVDIVIDADFKFNSAVRRCKNPLKVVVDEIVDNVSQFLFDFNSSMNRRTIEHNIKAGLHGYLDEIPETITAREIDADSLMVKIS